MLRLPHIGKAIGDLRAGRTVRRASWNSGRVLTMHAEPDPKDAAAPPKVTIHAVNEHGKKVIWNPEQDDVLAQDWEVVEV